MKRKRRGAREQARIRLPAPADLDRLAKAGCVPQGQPIHLMVAAWAWGAYLGEEGMKRGIRVKTSSYTRHHVNITMTQAKAVSNYTNSILANMEALDDGYDEALLLDSQRFCESKAPAKTSLSSRTA
jgi:branched-chain amino acid aminotransferase